MFLPNPLLGERLMYIWSSLAEREVNMGESSTRSPLVNPLISVPRTKGKVFPLHVDFMTKQKTILDFFPYKYLHCCTCICRQRSPAFKSDLMSNSSDKSLTTSPEENLSNVGFGEEPDLVDLCDSSGHIWVHERCAAWTLATIATKSMTEFTIDLTNQILSKVKHW